MTPATRRRRGEHGFTLIELLVVMVVIGILVAIAVPTYLHFKRNAYAATAKVDLHTLQLEQQRYNSSNSRFGTTRELAAANPNLKMSESSGAAVIWSNTDGYCLAAANSRGPEDSSAPFASSGFPYKTFFYDSRTGKISDTLCATPSGAAGLDGYIDDTGLR